MAKVENIIITENILLDTDNEKPTENEKKWRLYSYATRLKK